MSSHTILVADDDRGIRTVLAQALERAGYQVRVDRQRGHPVALDGATARAISSITDVVMPDENGLDLMPRIRKLRPDLRVIVMSAQNTLLTAVKATERGAFEYLPKPFDLQRADRRCRPRVPWRPPARPGGAARRGRGTGRDSCR